MRPPLAAPLIPLASGGPSFNSTHPPPSGIWIEQVVVNEYGEEVVLDSEGSDGDPEGYDTDSATDTDSESRNAGPDPASNASAEPRVLNHSFRETFATAPTSPQVSPTLSSGPDLASSGSSQDPTANPTVSSFTNRSTDNFHADPSAASSDSTSSTIIAPDAEFTDGWPSGDVAESIYPSQDSQAVASNPTNTMASFVVLSSASAAAPGVPGILSGSRYPLLSVRPSLLITALITDASSHF